MQRTLWHHLLLAGIFSMTSFAHSAEPAVTETPTEPAALVSVDSELAVTVSTGNEVLDETANLLMRCTERNAALEACGGGLRGMACRKALEVGRYKNLECPEM